MFINAFKVVNIWIELFVDDATSQGVLALVVALAMRLATFIVRPYEKRDSNVKQANMFTVVRKF